MGIDTEHTILKKCRDGDKASFRWVVQTYQRMVFSLALKMLADEEEAKDVVQDTFIRVWQNLEGYDFQRPFATWLYTIATRLCLDRLRRMHIKPMPQDETVLRRFADEADTERTLENSEWTSIVRLLAAELSEKQRLVFTLCQLEGLSMAEVERISGIDVGKVKSNLHAARQKIRKRLTELGYE